MVGLMSLSLFVACGENGDNSETNKGTGGNTEQTGGNTEQTGGDNSETGGDEDIYTPWIK